jgi:HAD superfamily hydrolase (TIGR01509 family)
VSAPAPSGDGPAAVLLDVYGTLLELEPPAPRLARLLAEAGWPNPDDRVRAAVAAEIRVYRSGHHLGRDAESLLALRRACAAALAEELPDPPPLEVALELLLAALRFRVFPEVPDALDALVADGRRLAAVSDWDCSLPDALAAAGLLEHFDAVVASAELGASKPHPVVFRRALARLGVEAHRALHCGDDPVRDCAGARGAGIAAVLLVRGAAPDGDAWPTIGSLAELPALARGEPAGRRAG